MHGGLTGAASRPGARMFLPLHGRALVALVALVSGPRPLRQARRTTQPTQPTQPTGRRRIGCREGPGSGYIVSALGRASRNGSGWLCAGRRGLDATEHPPIDPGPSTISYRALASEQPAPPATERASGMADGASVPLPANPLHADPAEQQSAPVAQLHRTSVEEGGGIECACVCSSSSSSSAAKAAD